MSPSLWNRYGSFICLKVCLLNYKFLWAQYPASSLAWSPLCCAGLQGYSQFLLQKQVHIFVSPIQHEAALQNFPFYSPFKSLLLLLSSLVMLEESNLLSRIFLQKIGLFLPAPLFIQPPSRASVQAKHSCQSQVFCPGSTTQSSLQGANTFTITQSPYRNTLNTFLLHHHMWNTKSLLLQIFY